MNTIYFKDCKTELKDDGSTEHITSSFIIIDSVTNRVVVDASDKRTGIGIHLHRFEVDELPNVSVVGHLTQRDYETYHMEIFRAILQTPLFLSTRYVCTLHATKDPHSLEPNIVDRTTQTVVMDARYENKRNTPDLTRYMVNCGKWDVTMWMTPDENEKWSGLIIDAFKLHLDEGASAASEATCVPRAHL